MESPSSPPSRTPPPAPPGRESGERVRAIGSGGRISVQPLRRFPKPPPLFQRFVHLCLRPEAWAETARYPTRVTLMALLLAILLGATIVGCSFASQAAGNLKHFATLLDSGKYPAIELTSAGVLRATGPLPQPLHIDVPGPARQSGAVFLIDPTGKTTPESLKDKGGILVTSADASVLMGQQKIWHASLAKLLPDMGIALPAKGQTSPLTGAAVRDFIHTHTWVFAYLGVCWAISVALTNALWAAVMIFFVSPILRLAAAGPRLHSDGPERRLLLPRRAATRMAAGLLVPLIVLDAGLNAVDHPVGALLGPQGAVIFWFFAAAALAVWTGVMAKHIYAPKPRPQHRQHP